MDGEGIFDDPEELAFALGLGEEISEEMRDEIEAEMRAEMEENSYEQDYEERIPLSSRHKSNKKVPPFEQYVRDRIAGRKKAFDFLKDA